MKHTEIIKSRKSYSTPQIEMIKLDNEISLQLASESTTPPADPSWVKSKGGNDPYQEEEYDYLNW